MDPRDANEGTIHIEEIPGSGITRREVISLVVLVAAAILLRSLSLEQLAVEHFDEGVYASNLWFDSTADGQYPNRQLYAPPLFPKLLEWSMVFFGTRSPAIMLPNIIIGAATVGLVWWVARTWFGSAAGLAAALLAALSDFHRVYSRTALTDPLLSLAFLAAVYLIWEALRRRKWTWIIAAGGATAFAWWTKYNGWLPLAIGLAGLIPWILQTWPTRPARYLIAWLLVSLTAVLVWSPVLWGLSASGGYAAVQANHQGYFVGLQGWLESLARQYSHHRHFDSWLGVAGLVGAALLAEREWSRRSSGPRQRIRGLPTTGLAVTLSVALAAAVLGMSGVLAVCALIGLALQVLPRQSDLPQSDDRRLAAWMLAAWFVGLIVVTPLYQPFPRITLPWLVSAWLGTAALVGACLDRTSSASVRLPGKLILPGVGLLVLACAPILWSQGFRPPRWTPVAGRQDRAGLARIAAQIVKDMRHGGTSRGADAEQFVVYVYGEPAVFYHLRVNGATALPVANLSFAEPASEKLPVPTYLVIGPHARHDPSFQEAWQRLSDRFERVDEYDYRPSDLVLLNQHSAGELRQPAFNPETQIELLRRK